MSEEEKQAQIDEMWEEHLNEGWWNLHDFYHSAYRGQAWPSGAREEVLAAKAKAEGPQWPR
jgi:hypothetical protein